MLTAKEKSFPLVLQDFECVTDKLNEELAALKNMLQEAT